MPGDQELAQNSILQTTCVIFRGRVQGVGFRYTTCRIANNFPVTGYVKNMPDGTVKLVARSRAETITAFIDEIRRVMSRNLTDVEIRPHAVDEEFVDFSIRY